MPASEYTRRSFLKAITGATLASMSGGMAREFDSLTGKELAHLPNTIPDEAVILFQGDSITDSGRDRENRQPNHPGALGNGYTFLAAAKLRHSIPEKNPACYNRGISGNKVFQLAERWEEDCLQLEPDILSILIGVNDFWHTQTGDYEGTVETYENDYHALIRRTKEAMPEVQLIIGEPFAVKEGTAVNDNWYPVFDRYREAARRVAHEFGAAFIPYQSVFDEASRRVSGPYWTGDGVHPTLAGSQLMVRAWIETVKRM
ncbi:MAG: SGNH/GDSL hydrolase family protein [Balneolaceae bacterium]|nr:SGNH/GDSL hydrolase family protein [Balneolaceae bacterium]